jgi:phosphate transport system permease protein
MAANAFEGAAPPGAITHPPSSNEYLVDRGFRLLAVCGASLIILLVAYILWKIGGQALPAIYNYHLGFLTSTNWNVSEQKFGILPEIWGTLYSSFLALVIGGFFGLTVAIFLTQDFLPPRIALVFRTIIDMLAAIPSVVFGLWGIFVVIPAIRPIANWLNESLGWFPFFGTSLSGPGLLPAALVLAIMILRTVAAISQDALHLVPYRTKEAAYGMGTTRWECDPQGHASDRGGRHRQRDGAGFRPSIGPDDGARHADRQFEPDQPVAVRAGADARIAARLAFSGSRPDRSTGVDVCRPGSAGDQLIDWSTWRRP